MEVLFLTTLFSVVFAIFFLVLFFNSRRNRASCSDQEALIPFRHDNPSATADSSNSKPSLNPTRTLTEDDQR